MSQLRRIKTLVQASFRRRPPERAEPGARVTPLTLGSTSAVPQSGLTKFDAGGYEIAVANVEGTFYALSDICTHRGCSLSEGELDGTTLECICHGSRFDVSTVTLWGDQRNGPSRSMRSRCGAMPSWWMSPQRADGRPGQRNRFP